MKHEEFINKCIKIVRKYETTHEGNYFFDLDKMALVRTFDFNVFVVWSCKTLQNSKALLSTTLNNGRYYEFTLNGDKEEIYMDVYKKTENRCIKEAQSDNNISE